MKMCIYFDDETGCWAVAEENQYPMYFDTKKEALNSINEDLKRPEKEDES